MSLESVCFSHHIKTLFLYLLYSPTFKGPFGSLIDPGTNLKSGSPFLYLDFPFL